MKYTLKDIVRDLNLEGKSYKVFVKMWKKDLKKAVNLINEDYDLIDVLGSDLEREKDFLEEVGCSMKVCHNINGIVLYKRERV